MQSLAESDEDTVAVAPTPVVGFVKRQGRDLAVGQADLGGVWVVDLRDKTANSQSSNRIAWWSTQVVNNYHYPSINPSVFIR
jgi:hypothetical protein